MFGGNFLLEEKLRIEGEKKEKGNGKKKKKKKRKRKRKEKTQMDFCVVRGVMRKRHWEQFYKTVSQNALKTKTVFTYQTCH